MSKAKDKSKIGAGSDGMKPVSDGGGESLLREGKAPRIKKKRYTRDDMGNAERLLDDSGSDLRWDKTLDEWVVWSSDRSAWIVDSNEAMRRAKRVPAQIRAQAGEILLYDPDDKGAKKMEEWGNQSGNLSRLEAMLKTARSEVGVSVTGYEWDSDVSLLNCPNGTVVLGSDGAFFRETRKEDMCTKATHVPYVADARSKMFDNFLDTFLPEADLREWLQKVAGYSLFGSNPARKIVFALGPTSSGKSTFAELCRAALGGYSGGYNLSMLRDNQDERARPDIVRALSQRMIFASETSSAWKLHADMIKRAVGQDPLLARLPHVAKGVERVPSFVPWILTNNVPTIEGADKALYRRLCTVVFPHTIPQEKEKISWVQQLIEVGELEGVLAWLVEGWNLYCADRLLLDSPHRVVRSEMKMREQFSDFDIWLASACEMSSDYDESPTDLFDAYERWAELNGIHGRERMSGTGFGRALNARGHDRLRKSVGGEKVWRRTGIRLRKALGSE